MPEEWITVVEAAELLGISRRQVLNRIHEGKLKAKREGSKWLVHSSLEAEEAEVGEPPTGGRSEEVRRLEEQVQQLQEENAYLRKELSDSREQSNTIILQLTRQLENQQKLLEYHQEPWYRRWLRRNRVEEV